MVEYIKALEHLEAKLGVEAQTFRWRRAASYISEDENLQQLVVALNNGLSHGKDPKSRTSEYQAEIVAHLRTVNSRYICFQILQLVFENDGLPAEQFLDEENLNEYREWLTVSQINDQAIKIANTWAKDIPDRFVEGVDLSLGLQCNLIVALIKQMKSQPSVG